MVQGTLGGLKPVCFDRFGEELMRHGLSAEVIGGMVRQQMGGGKFSATFEVAASPWGPLDVSVELALKSVAAVPTTAPPMSEGRVFTLAAKVQAMYAPAEKGGGEAKRNHRLFRLAGIGLAVVVHMRTAKHPASVVPVPADLEHWRLDIDWSKLEVINEEWEAAVKEWLQGKTKGNVDEWLRRQWRSAAGFLESQLPLLGGLLAQTISKISEDAAQKTPGPVDTPPPVGGEHLFSNEIKGVPVLAPGRAGYHEVQLKRGQKIKVEAEVRPEGDVEYVPAYASVQVLDGFKGVLTQMPRLEFPKGKRTPRRVRIVFKVPADGTYYLGIKLWPRVDDTALAGVRFRITAAPA